MNTYFRNEPCDLRWKWSRRNEHGNEPDDSSWKWTEDEVVEMNPTKNRRNEPIPIGIYKKKFGDDNYEPKTTPN